MTLVSIIIPYIDEHDYLSEAIASASGQLDVETEIIIVCNAPNIPAKYDPIPVGVTNIKFLHEPIPGSAFARNKGLSHASGDWIQFLDVDDLLLQGKIKKQLHQVHAGVNTGVVISPHTYLFLNGRKVPSAWAPEDVWSGLLASELGSTSSMLWNRHAIQQVGGWNEIYTSNQEYELLFRTLKAGYGVLAVDDNLTVVRERLSGSITKTASNRPLAGIRLREQIWSYLTEMEMKTPHRFNSFQKYVFKNLRALYITDVQEARVIYERYFVGTSFVPDIRAIPLYKILYKLLGFEPTEKLMHIYRYTRDHFFKSLPANV